MAAKDPQKYTLSEVYGIYDYDYVHHAPYGPTSVEVQTEHPNSQVDDVVNMYLNEAKFRTEPGTMEPPTSRCSCCSDVNSYNAKHRTREAAVSRHPFVQYPTVPPIATSTPTLFTETIMHPPHNGLRQEVFSSSEPDFRSPSPSLESKLYTKPDILPLSTDDERKMYLTQPQRSRFFNEFGMRDTRHTKRAEEVVSASYKYNVAMEKLNRTVQSMDSGLPDGVNKRDARRDRSREYK